jgi:hypothetical protein
MMGEKPEAQLTGIKSSAAGAYDVTEHMMSLQEVGEKLETSVNVGSPEKSAGLTASEVRRRA